MHYKTLSLEDRSFDEARSESINILKYFFHIDYEGKKQNLNAEDEPEIVNRIMKVILPSANQLFDHTDQSMSPNNSYLSSNFNFFGQINYGKNKKSVEAGPLSKLAARRAYPFWEELFLNHCVISTYDKLLTINENSSDTCKVYSLIRYKYDGLSEYRNNSEKFSKERSSTSSGEAGSRDSSYKTYVSTLQDTLSKIDKRFQHIMIKTDNPNSSKNRKSIDIDIAFLPFVQSLYGLNSSLRNCLPPFSEGTKGFKKWCSSTKRLQTGIDKNLNGSSKGNGMKAVDQIFYKYSLEKVFNFDLIYCTLKNISTYDEIHPEFHIESNIGTILPLLSKIPDIYGRTFLLQMIFDCCTDYFTQRESLLVQMGSRFRAVAYQYDKVTENYLLMLLWSQNACDFLYYFVNLVYPFYETLFFNLLYDYDARTPPDSKKVIKTMIQQMESYISENPHRFSSDFYIENINKVPSAFEQTTGNMIITADYEDNFMDAPFFKSVASDIFTASNKYEQSMFFSESSLSETIPDISYANTVSLCAKSILNLHQ